MRQDSPIEKLEKEEDDKVSTINEKGDQLLDDKLDVLSQKLNDTEKGSSSK